MIYLDQDGVLADFDGGLKKHGIVNDVWFIHKPKEEWTPDQVALDKAVVAIMRQPGYFRNLEMIPGAKELYDFVKHLDPWILTARPNEKVCGDRVTQEKKDWIREYLGNKQVDRTIVCLRSEKAQYATGIHFLSQGDVNTYDPNILVDDLRANCDAWEAAGGIAVWHQGDFNETIKKLEQLINA